MKQRLKALVIALTMLAAGLSTASASEDRMTLDVYLNSNGDNVNTFGGTLHLPTAWEMDRVDLEDTNLVYWVETPRANEVSELPFSGIIPGGLKNLDGGAAPLFLFSIDVWGSQVENRSESLYFSEEEFYLNHPAALSAENSQFSYKLHPSDTYQELGLSNDLLGLTYSFEKDPLTQQPVLVLNSSQGNLASYDFHEKEGEFGFGEWFSVDSVRVLGSDSSTVTLSADDGSGVSKILHLRSSFLHKFLLVFGAIFFFSFSLYLLLEAYKILRFRPDLPK